ncbi:rhomboid family intramembrane serine protease [Marivita geojedonensis]|uniref:Peptidase C54 n=1 Tax=Marivita geojedonensis TaxID=1123756 RepID=A0A1X4NHI0_9RHOB|nr:rhomboid family intramembrane serine protease [Marivita geojedonensis]OSQ46983.1 peptidase C54 [Marivita geojedonensis]PRY74418.1 membrane associated rhomboid family serine protease [Marivita geojedonensis]
MFPIRDHNPSGRTPFVTYALIIANVGIFLSYFPLMQNDQEIMRFYFDYALIPALVSEGQGFSGFLTSMFLHGGWMHLIGNMLFLFIFGDNMEDEMGHFVFLLFYLAAGLGAAYIHYISAPLSQVPTVGASGAIAGVMGGYLLLFPKAKVDILIIIVIIFRILPIPAWIMLGLWFAMQIFGGFGTAADEGGVAYWAHVGGFVIGLGLTVPLWLRLGGPSYWNQTEGHPPHPEATYRLSRSNIPHTGPRSNVPRIRRK